MQQTNLFENDKTRFRVPIKPHLKKILLKQFYPNHRSDEFIKVEEDSLLGRHIMSILIDKRTIKKATGLLRYDFQDELKLELSQTMAKRSPRIDKLTMLNHELDEIFQTALFVWIKAQKHSGISAKRACESFIAFYELENDYTFDAAHRAWNRYINNEYERERQARKQKKDKISHKKG